MNKITKLLNKISKRGPHVELRIEPHGFAGKLWVAEFETNFTDLYERKWFDDQYTITAIEKRYIMREYGSSPKQAVKNIHKRLLVVSDKMKTNKGYK